ncbi:uncharacterized protein PGTG_15774 [Puccinia graminis f. sp. tritici CRL 75-36-700-3]|uniref:Uncharacterized protein n=1 Tax=Puccinia graminis f. sp. tritici (strain CRL 75-36-700-3 / race SCCL) TaxID=418459 RepID=E3KZT7_PUCGT|nr:uncharacterized protein PGTG_15774 [Puccinia graminis f. sp. tritici CRL 75-36-700-3]EFP89818.2 hypothetical protein PGTG_15774 [Puccinia graminis f. sp. tritici CRL 75-36-700-3]
MQMAVFQFVLMAMLCLQVLAASPPAKKPACLNNLVVKNEDCERAKSKIVYDKGILSKVETKVSVVSKDCLIEIYNPKQTVVTTKQIDDTVTEVLTACKSGHVRIKDNQEVGVWVTPRPKPRNWYSPYDPDVELGKAFCFAAAEGKVVKEECMQAFNQITTDNLGSLMSLNEATPGPRHSYTSKYKSCRPKAGRSGRFYYNDQHLW